MVKELGEVTSRFIFIFIFSISESAGNIKEESIDRIDLVKCNAAILMLFFSFMLFFWQSPKECNLVTVSYRKTTTFQ